MLRIDVEEAADQVRFRLWGQLAGPSVRELERVYASFLRKPGKRTLVVELSEVTGMDQSGQRCLQTIRSFGGQVEGASMLVDES